MSRQREHSPGYRTFPWDEPGFDPRKVLAQLDGMHKGWGEGDGPREPWRERRHPQEDRRQYQEHGRRSEEPHPRRRNSPFHEPQYLDAGEGPRHREAFRENQGRYEDRRGDELPNRNFPQRESGWRQDQPDRGSSERFRDRSPLRRDNNRQRGGGRGQYKPPLIHRDKWTPNQDDQQHIDRNRRDMDDSPRSGYERQEQRFSADERREGFYRNEHEFTQNRNEPMEPFRHERYSPERAMDRPRSRSLSREDMRGGHFEENPNDDGFREERSTFDDRPNHNQFRGRPANRRGSRGNFNRRGRFFHRGRWRGRGRGYRPQNQRGQNLPNEASRFREDVEFPEEAEPSWEQREVDQGWEDEEDCDRERPDLEMQHPEEQWGRNKPKNDMMVITEETLTIKVDMSRPVNKNSLMLYSADRPLSLDLVHVGRQRLDFLTSGESPGPNRENLLHTGTFAQEIITLVHKVKDQYFGGQGITLSERFSASQSGELTNEEPLGMTLNKRFSSNRGVNINYNSLQDREETLFSKQGPLQLLGAPPLREPDDLRHDLEKRRQERLEGVKVTISGRSQSQRAPGEQTFGDDDLVEESSTNWTEEPQWRQEGPTGPKRGGYFGRFRGNNRQMRRPNFRNNSRGGQNW